MNCNILQEEINILAAYIYIYIYIPESIPIDNYTVTHYKLHVQICAFEFFRLSFHFIQSRLYEDDMHLMHDTPRC